MRLIVLICSILIFAGGTLAGNKGSALPEKNIAGKAGPIKGKTFIGKPIFLDDVNNTLILQNGKKVQMEFTVADTAKVIRDGRQISLKGLDTKKACTAVYKKKRDVITALRIEQNPSSK